MHEATAQNADREVRRESFRQETVKAWKEYQDTGMHASVAEVDTWLSSWGTENEVPAPACRE